MRLKTWDSVTRLAAALSAHEVRSRSCRELLIGSAGPYCCGGGRNRPSVKTTPIWPLALRQSRTWAALSGSRASYDARQTHLQLGDAAIAMARCPTQVGEMRGSEAVRPQQPGHTHLPQDHISPLRRWRPKFRTQRSVSPENIKGGGKYDVGGAWVGLLLGVVGCEVWCPDKCLCR